MADDFLNMSDEDIRKMGVPDFSKMEPAKEQESSDEAVDDAPADAEPATDGKSPLADPDTEPAGDSDTAAEEDAAEGQSPDAAATEGSQDQEKSEEVTAASKEEPVEEAANKATELAQPAAAIDYKAEYEKLLAPFQANGRQMTVKSVEDAVTLMQMGANYNKKMAALKPNLKLMKLLENAGLLNEQDIGYMIDLRAKNPNAINKLVKDSGIDPVDLDAEKAGEYKPSSYTVDERELALDEVLDPIKDSPHFQNLIGVVSNKWDSASKKMIADAPQILGVIHGHMASGIYDRIMAEVENERLFNRLNGLSDLQAYKQIGDAMHARGAFNDLTAGSSPVQSQAAPVVKTLAPKPVKAEEANLKDKRRAASSTKAAAPAAQAKEFDPLNMSDEEFSKHVQSKFL